jgi:hypothetical protein
VEERFEQTQCLTLSPVFLKKFIDEMVLSLSDGIDVNFEGKRDVCHMESEGSSKRIGARTPPSRENYDDEFLQT